jgi:site-specific DNA-cytosine methylase
MTLCFLERAGCAGGGKGILCSEEKTFTLSTVDNMRICMQEVYSVDSKSSNSMKSKNPHSGFHVSKVFKTLDTTAPDPSKNQGGHIIMEEKVSVIEMGALARGQGNRIWDDNCPTLRAEMGDNQPCVMMKEKVMAFAQNTRDEVRYQNGDGQIVGALAAQPGMKQTTYIQTNTVVRRLTPVECERLQGFPDNYTNIPWGKKDTAPDCRRYKAIGNSMAVPVMQWIGKRMLEAKQEK